MYLLPHNRLPDQVPIRFLQNQYQSRGGRQRYHHLLPISSIIVIIVGKNCQKTLTFVHFAERGSMKHPMKPHPTFICRFTRPGTTMSHPPKSRKKKRAGDDFSVDNQFYHPFPIFNAFNLQEGFFYYILPSRLKKGNMVSLLPDET